MAGKERYFLYARKSTDVEDKQVRSIDAQLFELREIAERDGLSIVEEFIEKQSAKNPGRPMFNNMLERLERGEATGILTWHADRLARNSLDAGRIIYLIDTGKLRRLQFHSTWVENNPQGKMMLNTEFGFSKYYVDTLAERVKCGIRDKVRDQEYPGLAPIGYNNDPRIKQIVVDRERAPLVKRAFEIYAEGRATLDSVGAYLGENGIRSKGNARFPGGKHPNKSRVTRILSNPVYYGDFKWAGEIHEGCHEAIITKKLFDDVQAVLNRRWRYSPQTVKRTPKPFLQLLRCGECGSGITGEIQKGRTYYRCTKKNRAHVCSQPYVREDALDSEITSILSSFKLRPEWANEMLAKLETERVDAAKRALVLISERQAEKQRINQRLHRLRDSFLDELIDRDDFLTEKAKIMSRRKTLDEQIASLTRGSRKWLEPFKEWILAAQQVDKVAHDTLLTEKAALAQRIFGSNLVLDRKKARGEAVKPWPLIPENANEFNCGRLYDSARTYFQGNFPC